MEALGCRWNKAMQVVVVVVVVVVEVVVIVVAVVVVVVVVVSRTYTQHSAQYTGNSSFTLRYHDEGEEQKLSTHYYYFNLTLVRMVLIPGMGSWSVSYLFLYSSLRWYIMYIRSRNRQCEGARKCE